MSIPAIPDYISPIVGYRVWNWDAIGLWSLNGERWFPDRALASKCPRADHEPPTDDCSCGVYAAKNYEHLQRMFSTKFVEDFVHGEVHLWGKVVEHDLGYRAQFAYPKSLVLPFNLPSSIDPRLESSSLEVLMVYGADISLAPNILLWTKRSGYTPAGSDWLIGRGKPCGKWCEQWHERTLQMGDYVTVLGRGIGLVERDDSAPSNTLCIRLRNDYVFIVPQQGIVWNCQTWRWEAERWDVDLSGYRDKGCRLLVRRKFRSSNGKGSNGGSSSPGDCASTLTSSPDDDLDARLKEYWKQWEQKYIRGARSTEPKAYEARVDKKTAPEKIERPHVPSADCEQVCGVCGSFDDAGKNSGEKLTASQPRKAVGERPLAGRILVVDDEKTIRQIIASILVSANYECREAASGVEALAMLESAGDFDLVLDDLMMPDMDGIALLERIKDKYPSIPVVIVTAVDDIQVALQALRNEAYDYLLKPFEREHLLATVRRALETRRVKLENDAYRTNLEALVAARTQQWKDSLSDLERAYDLTLEGFGDSLALRDAAGHSKRVTAYVIAMARKIGLPKERISIIARGAFLHDIGKLAIPDGILRKPGALTADETVVMREHCLDGYKMLKKFPFLSEAAEIVVCHQERYDGSGYPRRLKGEQIPLGARLVAVANTLDVITSDQPYRAAQSFGAARAEIERWSGRQFDPEIVGTFLDMPHNIWEDLREDIAAQVNRLAPSNSTK